MAKKKRMTYQTYNREEIKNVVDKEIGRAAGAKQFARELKSSVLTGNASHETQIKGMEAAASMTKSDNATFRALNNPKHPQHRTFKRMLIKRRARQGSGSAAGAMLPMRMEN